MSLIDPNLLQLIGLGSTGDPDVADGRHLRWLFHRTLGFPRTGFKLTRRPSLVKLNFEAPPPGTPPIRSQLTRQTELGTGARMRFASGLTVSKEGGFVFGPAESGGQPLLRLDTRLVSVDFGAEGSPPPTSGELMSNPAAYVLITIARRSRSGFAVARAYYNGRPTLRLVDRAAVGGDLRSHVADLAADVTTAAAAFRVLSYGERLVGVGAVVRRDALASAAVAGRGLRPQWPHPPIADPNPFVTETLLLHGGLIEHIDLNGHDANLLRVQWITTRDLLTAQGWTELKRFPLPLTDAPDVYPAWAPDPGEKVAALRLNTAVPSRQAPWDRENGAGQPMLQPSAATSVSASIDRRYLGPEFEPVDVAMREFLRGELLQVVPQCLVQVTERLEPDPGDASGPEPMEVTVAPFDMLYGASVDPYVARELGLSALDTFDPGGIYDYAIEAGFATIWVQWVIQPRVGRDRAERLRAALAGKPAEWKDHREFAPFSIASVLTGLKQVPAVSLDAPVDLKADVIPDPERRPVQALVHVHWARGATNLFESPEDVRVLHAFMRESGAGDVLLHHRDDETKLLAPHLPTPYGEPEPRLHLVDRGVPSHAVHTWKVAAMDLFGRVSPNAAVTAEVRDTIPPPAPANVATTLVGDATSGPAWTNVLVAFDWMPAHEALAPDLSFFELNLRQGLVASADILLPTTWGRFETTPGAAAGPVRLAFPSLVASGVPAGVTIAAEATALAEGGQRIVVDISPIASPFDATGYARVAAAVRAVDTFDNASAFALAQGERVNLFVPPPPTFAADPLRATPADAQNRSWFRAALPSIPDARVRVLRSSAVALLAASGTDPAAFAALDIPNQVGLLRTLAVSHREPFATDHEQPLAADGGGYLMEFAGFDRGLTVIHIAVENRNGARSPWPSSPAAFLVVAVPRAAAPPPPLVRDIRVGDGSVRLAIAPDVTASTRGLALYRARRADDATDIRRMRPVAKIAIPTPPSDEPAVVVDSGLFNDVDYFYRVVAIGDGDVRSAPTGAMRATPISQGPPAPPHVNAIERDPTQPDRRLVRLLVPRRDYPLFLFRRRQFAPAWEAPSGIGVGTDGRLDLAMLVTTPDTAGYQVVVDDVVPVADTTWSYFARIEDPRGRVAASAPLMEPA